MDIKWLVVVFVRVMQARVLKYSLLLQMTISYVLSEFERFFITMKLSEFFLLVPAAPVDAICCNVPCIKKAWK